MSDEQAQLEQQRCWKAHEALVSEGFTPTSWWRARDGMQVQSERPREPAFNVLPPEAYSQPTKLIEVSTDALGDFIRGLDEEAVGG